MKVELTMINGEVLYDSQNLCLEAVFDYKEGADTSCIGFFFVIN